MTILPCNPDSDVARIHVPHRGMPVRPSLSTEFRSVYSIGKRMDRVAVKRSRTRAQ